MDLITIWTDGIDKMKAFYKDIMGFEILVDYGEYVEFRNTGVRFAICMRRVIADADASFKEKASGQSFELAFPCDNPEDVDRTYQRLMDQGVAPVAPPEDMPWGQRTAFFKDPDGNIHELFAELSKKA
ncbi:MAG: VOC family protein [Candidatus Izemoplasmataceae bacterium]